jgi:hypothetical protein
MDLAGLRMLPSEFSLVIVRAVSGYHSVSLVLQSKQDRQHRLMIASGRWNPGPGPAAVPD